ncbi:unnamed protein product [Musa hybrid cultivar]
MENSTGCKHRSLLLAELARAQHLALQLVAHRDQHSPIESFKSLASNILSSIDKLIHIAGSSTSEAKQQLAFPNTVPEDPLRSANKDASAGNFDSVFHRNCNNLSKNRKTLPKKKIQVTVGSGGVAAALDDGYSWRKYGNKNILGSKHSRSVLINLCFSPSKVKSCLYASVAEVTTGVGIVTPSLASRQNKCNDPMRIHKPSTSSIREPTRAVEASRCQRQRAYRHKSDDKTSPIVGYRMISACSSRTKTCLWTSKPAWTWMLMRAPFPSGWDP